MTRKLAFVATAGSLGAAVFLTLGIALAGSNWSDASRLLGMGESTCGPTSSAGREITLPLAAHDSFAIHIPATVRYQPGGRAVAVISGDPALLDHVRLEAGQLRLDCNPGWFASRLDVKLSGPSISNWELRGNGDLILSQINQTQLALSIKGSGSAYVEGAADAVEVKISGSGETELRDLIARSVQVEIHGSGSVAANGTADALDVNISGSGEAELKDLTARTVRVNIHGSGDARLTAQVDADVFVSGSGDVELSGGPVMRRSEIRGSGSIQQVP
ncbi:head GIN domain-containing protein [uncultured Nitratireductor sp.]|uniref:head GIN domain-containing protein n=1 Tax=uncultured Nitratireductor sp. TaxID=520953 RepID=UPI0025FFDD8B|nr:head GIN domain-containing protein [uncultured Nitratireductor sp.]